MARTKLKGGTLTAPLPPALVTVGDEKESNVLTIAWTGIVCSDPALTYVSIRPTRHSYEILKRTGEFVVHLPSSNLTKKVDYCGIFTGAKVDKFEKCSFTKVPSTEVKTPTIAECPIALECRVKSVTPLGTHDMFLGEILAVTVDESLLDEKGKLHMEKANLIAYSHGEYYSLGKKIGHFGFSAAKKKHTGKKK